MIFDTISNYCEKQVFLQIGQILGEEFNDDPDFLADIACVTLNSLPPRYIRHHVDMAFYMTSDERSEMESSIKQAILDAVDFVRSRQQSSEGMSGNGNHH